MQKPILFFIFLGFISYHCSPKNTAYYHSNGSRLKSKSQHVLFASSTEAYTVQQQRVDSNYLFFNNCIGKPNHRTNTKRSCSKLEAGDYLIVQFNNRIWDGKSNDIWIFNVGAMQNAALLLSNDLEEWTPIGMVTDKKPYLDMSGKVPQNTKFTYLKILNTNKISNNNTTFFIDAIALLVSPSSFPCKLERFSGDTLLVNRSELTIKIKDSDRWDGDHVSVSLNRKPLFKKTLLTQLGRTRAVSLQKGENILKIKAHNEGWIHPNTLRLEIRDGDHCYFKICKLKKGKIKNYVLLWE